MEGGDQSPLELLAAEAGRDFRNLLRARERTAAGLDERGARLTELEHDPDAAVVLTGSWGRAEVTSGSDDDFMILVDGTERADVHPGIDAVKGVLDRAPGDQGVFGRPVFCEALAENIGLDRDDNTNLTRRMLFLLESVPVTAEGVHSDAREKVLSRYLDESIKDFRPPRFLLNDTVRYWRTMCVDFAGKEREGPEKWGLRNAKLRTSRKILFAGGLLPILECASLERDAMALFLRNQLDMPPTDRIADSFLRHGAVDAGARALGAYDEFLGLLDDQGFRDELLIVTRGTADDSDAFADVRRIGHNLQAGLLALLFETESLPSSSGITGSSDRTTVRRRVAEDERGNVENTRTGLRALMPLAGQSVRRRVFNLYRTNFQRTERTPRRALHSRAGPPRAPGRSARLDVRLRVGHGEVGALPQVAGGVGDLFLDALKRLDQMLVGVELAKRGGGALGPRSGLL